ncbi:MAG: DUF2911 domain-containing protein [Gemmatimonadales bacterium]|nr:DUF2911 domain-containing protein [Gemmatimonadales bacterium]
MRAAFAVLALTIAAAPLDAQIRASERARVSQVVDGTTITIDYARPRVRGRPVIFGGEVHWGEVWTPGANMATTLQVDRDIVLDGHPVPKGKYSVWMALDSATRWTMVLDTVWEKYHEERPPVRGGQIRWPITPASTAPTEALTWSFPAISSTGGTIRMAWADRSVDLPYRVAPSHPVTTPSAEAEPLIGRYAMTWLKPDGTVEKNWWPDQTVEVFYEKGALLARWAPKLWGPDDRTYLVRMAPAWFALGFIEQGEVVDVLTEWVFEFDVVNGRARGFEVRGERDVLMGRGVLTPSPRRVKRK